MKIAFIGEDIYSLIPLKALHSYTKSSKTHSLDLIITTRPKPKGRNKELTPTPIEQFATKHNINYLYYSSNIDELSTIIKEITSANIDLAVLTSFGHILPSEFITSFPKGVINIHPSLLPQYRGATPVQHSLALGDKTTGVTLFIITPNIDDGKIVGQTESSIQIDDTTNSLSTKLFSLGSNLLTNILDEYPEGNFPLVDQSISNDIIFTRTFKRDDGFIDYKTIENMLNQPSKLPKNTGNMLLDLRLELNPPVSLRDAFHDLHRALHPWPGLWSVFPTKKGEKRVILEATKPDLMLKIEGKPAPIPWTEFVKYYL